MNLSCKRETDARGRERERGRDVFEKLKKGEKEKNRDKIWPTHSENILSNYIMVAKFIP